MDRNRYFLIIIDKFHVNNQKTIKKWILFKIKVAIILLNKWLFFILYKL